MNAFFIVPDEREGRRPDPVLHAPADGEADRARSSSSSRSSRARPQPPSRVGFLDALLGAKGS